MANLLGQNIGTNYKGILNLNTLNGNLSATLQAVTDGDGNASSLRLSTTQAQVSGASNAPSVSEGIFRVLGSATNALVFGTTSSSPFGAYIQAGGSARYPLLLNPLQNAGSGISIGKTTNGAALDVRGDGTNPIARFENSSGSSAWAITATGSALTCESQARIQGPAIANDSSVVLGSFNNLTTTNGNQTILTTQGNIVCAAGSGNKRISSIEYTINNSGAQTGTATGIFLNATETALNGMGHRLADFQIGGLSIFRVANGRVISGGAGGQSVGGFEALNGDNSVPIYRLTRNAEAGLVIQSLSNVSFSVNNAFSASSYSLQLTSTGLLAFGQNTNAFPALKRNGAALEVRLADDSNFSSLSASVFNAQFVGSQVAINIFDTTRQIGTGGSGHIGFKATNFTFNNDNFNVANASAIVQIDSTTKGFLPPRMTNTQMTNISLPATGLVVYDTTNNRLNVYDGSNWISLH